MAGNYLIWLATAGLLATSAQAAQAPATLSLATMTADFDEPLDDMKDYME